MSEDGQNNNQSRGSKSKQTNHPHLKLAYNQTTVIENVAPHITPKKNNAPRAVYKCESIIEQIAEDFLTENKIPLSGSTFHTVTEIINRTVQEHLEGRIEGEKSLERIHNALNPLVENIKKYGIEFYPNEDIDADVYAAVLLHTATLEYEFHELTPNYLSPKAAELFKNGRSIYTQHGKDLGTYEPDLKLTTLSILLSNIKKDIHDLNFIRNTLRADASKLNALTIDHSTIKSEYAYEYSYVYDNLTIESPIQTAIINEISILKEQIEQLGEELSEASQCEEKYLEANPNMMPADIHEQQENNVYELFNGASKKPGIKQPVNCKDTPTDQKICQRRIAPDDECHHITFD